MPIEKTANYIRIRVANPSNFTRFRVKPITAGIRAVIGFKSDGGSEIQSLLFSKDSFTLAQAKTWVKKHNYSIEESYQVNQVLFDNKTNEIVFDEEIINIEDVIEVEETEIDWSKISESDWKWLMKR
jgi:hypothetical protein